MWSSRLIGISVPRQLLTIRIQLSPVSNSIFSLSMQKKISPMISFPFNNKISFFSQATPRGRKKSKPYISPQEQVRQLMEQEYSKRNATSSKGSRKNMIYEGSLSAGRFRLVYGLVAGNIGAGLFAAGAHVMFPLAVPLTIAMYSLLFTTFGFMPLAMFTSYRYITKLELLENKRTLRVYTYTFSGKIISFDTTINAMYRPAAMPATSQGSWYFVQLSGIWGYYFIDTSGKIYNKYMFQKATGYPPPTQNMSR